VGIARLFFEAPGRYQKSAEIAAARQRWLIQSDR
jgi:hypothetical protein